MNRAILRRVVIETVLIVLAGLLAGFLVRKVSAFRRAPQPPDEVQTLKARVHQLEAANATTRDRLAEDRRELVGLQTQLGRMRTTLDAVNEACFGPPDMERGE